MSTWVTQPLIMKRHLIPAGVALAVALFATVCDSHAGIAARKKEKHNVYDASKKWEKNYMDRGEVAPGFLPDMVYIAMGKADKVESKDLPEGHVDLWTYTRTYPEPLVVHRYQNTPLTAESAYQPAALQNSVGASTAYATSGNGISSGAASGTAAPTGSISKTGGPQGGTMEPAAPQSYTIQVLFENGKVSKMSCTPNMNN
jgi:hypothetical protein